MQFSSVVHSGLTLLHYNDRNAVLSLFGSALISPSERGGLRLPSRQVRRQGEGNRQLPCILQCNGEWCVRVCSFVCVLE